jgi:hypothetical protein
MARSGRGVTTGRAAGTFVQPGWRCICVPVMPTTPSARSSLQTRRAPALPDAASSGLETQTLAYVGLGLGGAGFVTTFTVLPRLYIKNPEWRSEMLPELRSKGVLSVSPREAALKARAGR